MAEPTSTKSNRRRAGQPIGRHPLFPAIAGLWLAVLLGFGSFLIKPAALAALVLAVHVDRLIPAAAPPLGMTARLAVALMLGGLGGLAGFVVARRRAKAAARPAPQVLRVADVEDPLPWPDMAGKPGMTPLPQADMPEDDFAPALDPSSLAGEAEPDVIAAPVLAEAAPAEFVPAEPAEAPAITPAPEPAPIPAPPASPTAAERIASAELADLSHVELIERLAIAMQRRYDRLRGPAEDTDEDSGPVVRFPGLADRQSARLAPEPAAPRQAPHETEKALREALAALQRMSGSG